MGICRFSDNFPKIYAKTRVGELHEGASQASSTQTKQTKSSPHEQSELREWASQAQFSQIKQKLSKAVRSVRLKRASRASKPPDPLQQTTTSLAYWSFRNDDDPKSCFKLAKNRIYTSWDSQVSQTVYLSLHLQNHMGFGIRWSWRVAKNFDIHKKVHGSRKYIVSTYTYPILSWFKATFCLLHPFIPSRLVGEGCRSLRGGEVGWLIS